MSLIVISLVSAGAWGVRGSTDRGEVLSVACPGLESTTVLGVQGRAASAPENTPTVAVAAPCERRGVPASSRAAAESSVRVVVVVAGGAAVPGAQVLFPLTELDWMDLPPALTQLGRTMDDPEALLAAAGGRVTTDTRGEAVVPRHPQGGVIVARAGSYYGATVLRPGHDGPLRVEMDFDQRLLVRAHDHLGQPSADVPIVLRARWRNAGRRERIETWSPGLTGATGDVQVCHPQDWVRRTQRPDEHLDECQLGVLVPGAEQLSLSVDPIHPGAGALVMVLPPMGSLTVEVRGTGTNYVELRDEGMGSAGTVFGEVCDRRGVATFPRVAVGGRYRVTMATDKGGCREATVSGPARAGATVQVQDDWFVDVGVVHEQRPTEPGPPSAPAVGWKGVQALR